MSKDDTIKEMLQQVTDRFGADLDIIDYWDGDAFAIGVGRHDYGLVYVSTYSKDHGRYWVVREDAERNHEGAPEDDVGIDRVFELVALYIKH